MDPVRVGIIGTGTISGIYLKNGQQMFRNFDIIACADVLPERARARAEEYGVPRACSVDELLADPAIEVVLNLTIPKAHGPIAQAALEAGKSVYSEKPIGLERGESGRLLETARQRGLRVGCAPDTFLGGGIQTCRKLIDDGWIGQPIGAAACFASHGPEGWHPDPDFYFQPGAGPLFDMGPYYLTALIHLLGPVRRVGAMARISFPERLIRSQPKYGQVITVRTPTHIVANLEFANGAIGTLSTSFDVWGSEAPRIEIFGTEGTLSVPDPNTFNGPVRIRRAGSTEWSAVPLTHRNIENSRGLGVADLAGALRAGRPHRANGALAHHVLDIMQSCLESSTAGRQLDIASTCERPAMLPVGLADGEVDAS